MQHVLCCLIASICCHGHGWAVVYFHFRLVQGASPYQVWQLRELAADSSCRAAMLESGAIPVLASLLADRYVHGQWLGSTLVHASQSVEAARSAEPV